MHKILVTGGAVLLIKALYDGFIAGSVPNREVFGFMPVQVKGADGKDYVVNRFSVTTDGLAFAGLVGATLGMFEGITRKVAP